MSVNGWVQWGGCSRVGDLGCVLVGAFSGVDALRVGALGVEAGVLGLGALG